MAKVTPGFKLYLYQLLSRELGCGKQTLLPQVEEVLAADDIIPADLECATVQELAEACPDFLKLRVFKKGRIYVTVLRNEEWDQMLAIPEEKPAAKKGGSSGGPKTWKKKKGGKKAFKAVKPGKQRRDREAAEARVAEERASAEAAAREEAAKQEETALADVANKQTNSEALSIALGKVNDMDSPKATSDDHTPASVQDGRISFTETQNSPSADTQSQETMDSRHGKVTTNGSVESQQYETGNMPAARTIAEILAESRAEEARSEREATQVTRKEAAIVDSQQSAQPNPAIADEQKHASTAVSETEQQTNTNPDTTVVAAPDAAKASKTTSAQTAASAPTVTVAAATALAAEPSEMNSAIQNAVDALEAAQPAPHPRESNSTTPSKGAPAQSGPGSSIQAPPAPEPSPISITITYDPYEDMERELERQRREEPPMPPRRPQEPVPQNAPSKPSIPLSDLPQRFGTEVSCKDALLRTLYQLLPYDVDPMTILDEDWRMARSTGSLSGSRNRVTFPLRYLHEDGSPVMVTLRKTTKSSFGKQWNLTLVDGDDGTGTTHLSVGFEGLPSVDEGAWSDLGGNTTSGVSVSPARILTQQVVIGTWDSFLGALAGMAAPERWNYPGEGVGKSSRYGILREYIATTFLRASRQERIAKAADSSFAAFHTGLSTTLGDDIYACLSKRSGDIPWQFLGFAPAGSGELGARLTGTIAELPEPATYLDTLSDVVADHKRLVILDTEAILGRQLGRLPRAFLLERLEGNAEARTILMQDETLTTEDIVKLSRIIKSDASAYRRLRRALNDAVEQTKHAMRASYRIAAPAFDPSDNKTKLLVPLCLVEDNRADCALVLDLQPSGAYRAAAILSLPRAYACARVISREQPGWLSADKVL